MIDGLPEGGDFAIGRGYFEEVRLDDVERAVQWSQTTIKMFGREILQPRLTSWMGDAAYTYSGRRHEPAPMPDGVARIRETLLELRPGFNSVLANLYRNGSDSVAWHADDEPELGDEPVIASVSLGAAREFRIRRWSPVNPEARRARADSWTITLRHGDLLVMRGRSQADYQHCIPKTTRPTGPRINLTFRTVTK